MASSTNTIKFMDLFGGIGGFRHGLEQSSDRFECVDYIEYDKHAVKSYNAIFQEQHDPRDVTELDTEQIPEHDLLCGGFPCQAFSIAGNRKGTDEARGKLFREIVRIARAKEPEMLLLENVKGLLSQKMVKDGESVEGTKGHAFRNVLSSLHELGYCLEWQVLNSKHWGVPQNRERVFIIGHLGGEPRSKVFPIRRENREDLEENGELGQIKYGKHDQDQLYQQDGLASAVRGNGNAGHHLKVLGNVNPSGRGMNGKVYKADETAAMPTISTNKGEGHKIINHQFRPEDRPSIENWHSGGSGLLYNSDYSYALSSSPRYAVQPVHTPSFADKNMNMKSRVGSEDGSMFTIDGTSQHGVKQEKIIRKLTPKECWRLQGFPDESFEKAERENSDTQLYKQAGNAVTVNVIKVLGDEILQYF